jgi:hypothetical protein
LLVKPPINSRGSGLGAPLKPTILAFVILVPAISTAPSMTAHVINVGQAHSTLLDFSFGGMLVVWVISEDVISFPLCEEARRYRIEEDGKRRHPTHQVTCRKVGLARTAYVLLDQRL